MSVKLLCALTVALAAVLLFYAAKLLLFGECRKSFAGNSEKYRRQHALPAIFFHWRLRKRLLPRLASCVFLILVDCQSRAAEAARCLEWLLSRPREGRPANELCDIYGIAARVYDATGKVDSADFYYRQIAVLQDSMLSRNETLNILNSEVREEIAKNDERRENELKQERLRTWLVVLALLLVAGVALFCLYRRMQSHRLATLRTSLELERERRKVVSSALAMTEKDNVLEAVLSDISEMKQGGEIGETQIRQLEQNVKMHLIGRQDWEDFKVLFEKVHPGVSSLLKATYPAVTEGDIRLSIYLKAGMNTKQIARMLQLQPDSVKKNRQRLRRHLGLTADQSLEDLLRSLG